MRNTIFTLVFLITSLFSFGQSKKVTQIDNNLYEIVIEQGTTKQEGYLIKHKGKYVNHGKWVLYSNNIVLTRGTYDKGVLITIISYNNGISREHTYAYTN